MERLSEAEVERLAFLMEECAEVQQICAKVLRHGYSSAKPGKSTTNNREMLEKELGDILYAISLLNRAEDVRRDVVHAHYKSRLSARRINYFHHQPEHVRRGVEA